MNRTGRLAIAIGIGACAVTASLAYAQGFVIVQASLSGYNEVPAVSTAGHGQLRARIDTAAQQIEYELSYSALEGEVLQAHIHFAPPAVNGGVSVFLCTNLGNGPVGTQACPPSPTAISGVIRPADVVGPAGQGVTAGQFDELVAAIRAGVAYVNVHSSVWPGGEVRGQLAPGQSQ